MVKTHGICDFSCIAADGFVGEWDRKKNPGHRLGQWVNLSIELETTVDERSVSRMFDGGLDAVDSSHDTELTRLH